MTLQRRPPSLAKSVATEEPHPSVDPDQSDRRVQGLEDLRAELTDPRAWQEPLAKYARTVGLAVALVDAEGQVVGTCQNPQAIWSIVRDARPEWQGSCPFCLVPQVPCRALADALEADAMVTARDQAGLAHVVVPLSLEGRQFGALLAGQVFDRYPDSLALARVARQVGVSAQRLWDVARQEVPVSRATLQMHAELLQTLGVAFLRQRWSELLERRLTATNRRFRLLIEGAKNYALFTVDRFGCVTSWNTGAEHLFGYTEEQIVGQRYARLFTEQDVQGDVPSRLLVTAERDGRAEAEHWWVRADSTRFLATDALVSLGEGAQHEFGLIMHDITHMRERDAAMFETQKLESIGVLAGGIAHDFNNLLTGVLGEASLMVERSSPDHPWRPSLEGIVTSAQRAADLTQQLLAYAGKGRFVVSRFDLSALVSEMPTLLRSLIPPQVQLQLALAPDLPVILGDASQIRQIVMNLVLNGTEAIGAGGGTVKVATSVADLSTTKESPTAPFVVLDVSDSGAGMDEGTQARIFEPFFTTKAMGRGLGLAAVSGIVRAHNGLLEVSSAKGAGTTFRVGLPSIEAGPPEPGVLLAESPCPATGAILVVDDECFVYEVARAILQHSGYLVVVAQNGQQAVDLLLHHGTEISAVLLDMSMPVMSGAEAFNRLRAIRPGLPIVLSSGYSHLVAAKHLGRDANTGFVQKPYTARALMSALRALVPNQPRGPISPV